MFLVFYSLLRHYLILKFIAFDKHDRHNEVIYLLLLIVLFVNDLLLHLITILSSYAIMNYVSYDSLFVILHFKTDPNLN